VDAQVKDPVRSPGAEAGVEERMRLEDVRLKIGETVQLQSTAERDPQRHYVKLIGYAKGRSFIVSTPMQEGAYLLIRDGQGYVVRMFAGKNIYAFPAAVIRSANTPFPHLHLTYPEEVVTRAVRKAERIDVRLIAAVDAGSSRGVPATVENLSLSGAGLNSKIQLGAAGAELKIGFKLELDGFARVLSLSAVIRISQPSVTAEGQWLTGIEFRDIEAQDHLLLSGFVYRALVENAG
jgi:c-di-GMP-binding flagellar brake protein YcgR